MMDHFKQECKLCDKIITDKNLNEIEDVTKEIFDILLKKLALIETQNVTCTTCFLKLTAALNFKTKCLSADNTIIPYVDLKQMYAQEKGNKQVGSSLNDRDVCRLCLEPVSGDHKLMQEVPVGSIEIYIPEINFEATTNPVICIKCHDELHVHSAFIKNCLDVDRKRNGDAMNGGEMLYNVESIKTEEIQIKSEETEEDILFVINKAEHDEGDTCLQSHTDLTHTEESKSLYELDQRKQASSQSTSESPSADHERQPKRALETQVNKSDGKKRRCPTRSLKIQEYECDKCTYNTKHKYSLMLHQLIHKDPSEVQTYECDRCLYRSIHKANLKVHQLTHKDPAEVKMYECDKCEFRTKQKGSLITHCLRHKDPAEVRVFHCDECDYKSIRKGDLKQHQMTHKDPSEARVFQCDECDYKSIQKAHLKQHQLRHKDPAQVKMFKCDKCSFETKHKGSLITHCLTHKDPSEVRMFNCDECEYTSIHKSALKIHQLKHKDPSEVQMFKCDECDYKTTQKSNLKHHQLRHKGPSEVRMFQCDECDYKATRKAHLKQHQLSHKDPSEGQL